MGLQKGTVSTNTTSGSDSLTSPINVKSVSGTLHQIGVGIAPSSQPATILPSVTSGSESTFASPSVPIKAKGPGRKTKSEVEAPRRRGKKQGVESPAVPGGLVGPDLKLNEQSQNKPVNPSGSQAITTSGSVSDIPTAHTPDSLPGSAALKCTTVTDQHSGIGIALNPQPTPPIPSASLVSQSTPPCASVPMPTKGQTRKTQSGAPRRRGRKQATVSLAAPDMLAGQDLKPNMNSQDNSGDLEQGRKENDALEMTNVVQEQVCHAPNGVPGQGKKSNDQSDNLAQGQQTINSSTTQESAATSPGPALGKIQDAVACEKQSVTVEISPENASSKPKKSELSRNEAEVVPSVPVLSKTVIEAIKSHGSQDEIHPVVSATNAAAPVLCPPDSFSGSSPVEGISKTLPNVAAKIAPSSQSTHPNSSVAPVSQAIPPCPSEPIQVKRQGRKTPARAEAPRRRGRKQAAVIPAVPDVSAGQDPKPSLQSQNRSGDSLGNKTIGLRTKQGTDAQELTNVIQAPAADAHLPGGLAGHDPKRKERSANAAQNKQPTSSITKLDGGAGTSDKTSALGRIQTANINDVARVMKEVFSGTCTSKTRIVESIGSEGRDTPKAAVSVKTFVEVAKIQSLEDKACSALQTMETAAPAFGEKKSESRANAKIEHDSAPILSEPLVPVTNIGKPESNYAADSVEKVEDSGQISNEFTPSKMENISTVSLIGGEKDVDPCQKAPLDGGPPGFNTRASCYQVSNEDSTMPSKMESISTAPINAGQEDTDPCNRGPADAGENPGTTSIPTYPEHSDMKSPVTGESGSTNKAEPSVKEPLGSSIGINSPEGVLTKADDVGDHPRVTSPILQATDHSGLVVAPDGVETGIHSGNKTECALKEYSESSPSNIKSIGCTTSSIIADDIGDHPREATSMSVSTDNSSVVKSPGVTQKNSEVKIDPSPKESPKSSPLDIESLEGPVALPGSLESSGVHNCMGLKLDMPSVEANATTCSSEAIAEGLEISQKDINCGAVVGPADTATRCDTITSDETPEKGQLVASCVGSEDKEDPMLETVNSVVAESSNADNLKDHDEMPLPPEIQSSEGGVEVHNMEVDPSEGPEKVPVSSSVPLEDSKSPEADMGDAIDASEASGILPEANISENVDLPSSSIAIEETEVDTSNLGPVGCSVALEDLKQSEAQMDAEMNVSQDCGIVPENLSEDMDVLHCPSTTKDENIEGLSEKGPDNSIVSMGESNCSKPEMDDQMDAVDSSEAVDESKGSEAEVYKKLDGLSDKGSISGSAPVVESKDSETEMGDQMVAFQAGLIISGNAVSEHMDLPSSSLGMEAEGLPEKGPISSSVPLEESKSPKAEMGEKGPISSSVPLEEPKSPKAEMGDSIDASQVGGILPQEDILEVIDLPSSSMVAEKNVEDSSDVGPVGSSIALEESKGSEAEIVDQMNVSQVGEIESGNALENMDLPQCSSATEGENIEGLSEKEPVGSSVAMEESNN